METPTHLMTHTCAVWRRTERLDEGGCPIADYTVVASLTAVRCRVQPGDDVEGVANDVERSRTTHVLYAEPVDIRPSDLLVLAAPVAASYNVISVYDPDDQHVYLRALLEIVV